MYIAIYTLLAVLLTVGVGWWRPWLKPSPTGSHHPPSRVRTFRVRGVPRDWDPHRLESFLAERDDSAGPAARFLANEIHGRSQTATVCFRNVPRQLLEAERQGRPWKIPLPAPSDPFAGPRSLTLDDGFLGITTLFAPTPQDHKVDIVAISGLGGHAFGSFKERDGEHMWLRDALSRDITGEGADNPIARVMLYGYSSSLSQRDSFQNLEDLGTSFHTSLRSLVVEETYRPIVIIAHSLGGLIVKQTIISLSKSKEEEDQKLLRAVYGIVFFGVPHGGMDINSLIPMVGDGRNRFLLESIGPFSSQILNIHQREFPEALGGEGESEIVCFYETRESPTAMKDESGEWKMTGPAAVLVTKLSATHCRPWENGPEHICAIDRTHSELVKFGPEDHEYEKVLGRIRGIVRRGIAARRRPLQSKLSEQAVLCLKSLAFPQMQDRFHGIGSAVEGTCRWLLEHKTYRSWATCNQGLLWIKGKPGSGKSTLLKYALGNHGATDDALILSFFFHGRGDELQTTPLGLFQSLLHQILGQAPHALQDLVDSFETKVKQHGKPGEAWRWHEEELRPFLASSLQEVLKARPVWLFIDALDECGKDNATKLVEIFKSLLKSLPSRSMGLREFRICFSCRHYPILDLDGVFEICLEDENGEDISTFVDEKLGEFRNRTSSTIPALIAERASGVFMWARLVVKKVLDLDFEGAGLNKIEAAVKSIPPDLDELYQQLIRSMEAASLKLIQLICFATRPLLTDELRWAMVIEADCPHRSLRACQSAEDYVPDSVRMGRQVQTLSRGLAEVSHAQVVQFIHQSVKDFFVEKGLSALDGNVTSTEVAIRAHFRFSRICVRYLAMEEIGRSTSYTGNDFPFLRYATTSWVAHTKQCDAGRDAQEDFLALFAWPSNALVERWGRVYREIHRDSGDCPPKGTSLVHVISRHGVSGLLTAMLQRTNQTTIDVNAKDGNGRTPLWWAAGKGHEAVVQLLLGTGKVDVDAKDQNGRTPLSYAAGNGHEAVVQLLLGTGKVDVDAKAQDGWTPLLWAAENGHKVVVQLLLGTGKVDVDAKDQDGRTPLSWAAENGHEAVVQLLLGTGKVDVDAKDQDGWTPLSSAAGKGHEAVVQLLLGTGKVNIDAKDKYGWTPLSWAAEDGHEGVVQLLLGTGKVDIDTKDQDGRTPLSYAAGKGHEAVVQLLLGTGKVNVDAKDIYSRTPLSYAAEYGEEAVIQLLLGTGKVDVDTKDQDGRTPLSWAAENGHEAVVQLLNTVD